jgi:predicted DNA-binding protein
MSTDNSQATHADVRPDSVVSWDYPSRRNAAVSIAATSLKIPAATKKRVATLAKKAGITPHAFMLQAIETEIEYAERYRRFVEDALAAEREMVASGKGIPLADVRKYVEQRLSGRPARRPRAKSWRR